MAFLDRVRPMALPWLLGLIGLALLAGACSEAEPQGFTNSRSGFLAACTDPIEDSRLTSSICQCVFDETQSELTFERFREIDETLVADLEADLPPEVLDIIAGCIIEAARL